ncbi:MAG: hypothetical protein MRY79_01040 [Alphaproteobacteria bacterium]|nr:hypothetical protein [Alphaproteobacteria bacterium]
MEKTLKSNDNQVLSSDKVSLPLPPSNTPETADEMEIYGRFMRHLRLVPNSRMEIKVLSAIQFTSDMLDLTDALVAKTLVDLGLRAPRAALPSNYLEHVDRSLMRSGWEVGSPTASALELRNFWDKIGEDKFAPARMETPLISETLFVET